MTEKPSAPAFSQGFVKLARQINAKATLQHLTVEPGQDCLPGRSFQNVAEVVRHHGGAAQNGWRMREQASAYVEGEFHAVWRRADGVLIDVTPRADGMSETLFLPDSGTVWTGDPVEPRRMMLHLQPCYCGSGMPFKICHGMGDE